MRRGSAPPSTNEPIILIEGPSVKERFQENQLD